jgi:drug/metabolite transporter (DMT)-like permease
LCYNNVMKWIFPLALLIVFEAVADIFAKQWSVKGHWWFGALSLASYLLANTFWLFALKNGSGLARGGMIFAVACAVLALGLGVVIYKEHLNKVQMAGVIFGIISLVLIFWNE